LNSLIRYYLYNEVQVLIVHQYLFKNINIKGNNIIIIVKKKLENKLMLAFIFFIENIREPTMLDTKFEFGSKFSLNLIMPL